jgi:hypothetical protein
MFLKLLPFTSFRWPQLSCYIKSCDKVRNVVLDLIILPSYMSHAFQALDVACFKLFKIAFKAYRDVWTLTNKVQWVEKEDLT